MQTLNNAMSNFFASVNPDEDATPVLEFYMQQRGLSKGQAMSLSVNGFVNDLVRQFPMEYSVELKRLIDLEMEGSVG